jgi:heptaprenyl diphosphate synthase
MTALVTKKLTPTANDRQIARFAALAIGFALIDAALPSPIPGVKPGLANIVTLVVLMRFGIAVATQVTIMRIIASSVLFGGFLSPGFLMSIAGGGSSLFILTFVYRLPAVGVIGCSVMAAFAHIMGQLLLARFWLIPHAGIWFLLPIFLSAAWVFGLVNGLIAAKILDTTVRQAK